MQLEPAVVGVQFSTYYVYEPFRQFQNNLVFKRNSGGKNKTNKKQPPFYCFKIKNSLPNFLMQLHSLPFLLVNK